VEALVDNTVSTKELFVPSEVNNISKKTLTDCNLEIAAPNFGTYCHLRPGVVAQSEHLRPYYYCYHYYYYY